MGLLPFMLIKKHVDDKEKSHKRAIQRREEAEANARKEARGKKNKGK